MRARVLFLGSAYHPLSVACLDTLASTGVELLVARDIRAGRTRATLIRVWRARGPGAVARRALLVAVAQARLALRRLGITPPGVTSLAEVCRVRGLATVPCADPNGQAFVRQVRDLGIDLIVVANYPHILWRRLFSVPPLGAINVHPSLLPAFRGPDPIYWMRASGASAGGVTVHRIDEGIDTGPIVIQRGFTITSQDDERAILARAVAVARAVLPEAVAMLVAGVPETVDQDTRRATYFSTAPRGASAL